MSRSARIIPAAAVALAALVISAVPAWRAISQRDFLTDGGTIREPAADAQPRDILWQPPTPNRALNTGGDEYEPKLTGDGQHLYFVRGRAGQNADILIATRTRGGWGDPRPLPICTQADELGPEPLPDGSGLLFYSDREGGHGGYDLWIVRREGDAWTEPVNLGPGVNSPFNEYNPAVSPDGRTLWFASNRPRPGETPERSAPAWPATVRESFAGHDYDLFRAEFSGSEPAPAEPVLELNTQANEGTPAFSPVGDFLYFSSDRPGGKGGLDLYRSRIVRGTLQKPQNLGAPVNSAHHELDPALSTAGFAIDFSSNRPLAGSDLAAEYNLFRSESREVYRESEPRSVNWAGLWTMLRPWLLALLLLLLLLLLLRLFRDLLRDKRLSTLTKCLLGSLMVHLIILFLLSLWGVTTSIGELFRKPGGSKVHLTSAEPAADSLTHQVRGEITDLEPVLPRVSDHQTPQVQPITTPSLPPPQVSSAAVTVTHAVEHHARDTRPADQQIPQIAAPEMQVSAPELPAPQSPSARAVAESVIEQPSPQEPAPAATARMNATAPAMTAEVPKSAVVPQQAELRSPSTDASAESPVLPGLLAAEPSKMADAPQLPTPAPAEAIRVDAEPSARPLRTVDAAPAAPSPVSTDVRPPSPQAPATTVRDRSAIASMPRADAPVIRTEIPEVTVSAPAAPLALDLASPAEAAPPAQVTTEPIPARIHAGEIPAHDRPTAVSSSAAVQAPSPLPAAVDSPAKALDIDRELRRDATAESALPNALDLAVPGPSMASLSIPSESIVPAPADLQEPSPVQPMAIQMPAVTPTTSATQVQIGIGVPDVPAPSAQRDARVLDLSTRRQDTAQPPSLTWAEPKDVILPAPATALRLPTETAPLENPYAQRDQDIREEVLKQRGGDEQTEAAVRRALEWLARHQHHSGRWDAQEFDHACGECGGRGSVDADIAVTGLALLCFYGADHTHMKEGPYREQVSRALDWLLRRQSESGDLRGDESLYTHAIASIALAEAYGMTRDERLKEPVAKAIAFIAASRSPQGGWRYEPGQLGDTSVLGWQVMAMVSAKRAGVEVPEESLRAAADWLDTVTSRPGIYTYQPGTQPSASMTAEGWFCRQLLGDSPQSERTAGSVSFLRQVTPRWGRRSTTYLWYYATLAYFQHGGTEWERWNAAVKEQLLANQELEGPTAGSWAPADRWSTSGGRVYQTAICTLTLEVYYRYLPMYAGGSPAPAAQGQPSANR